MLPDGNKDMRLIDYGFTPYGTHETPGEQLTTPGNFCEEKKEDIFLDISR